ncbi:DEAD/DEAH box helicase family protein [Thiofilum flexile]|uniref:DEAD/DEAH box helicase family protein n=1 Tax=Thiofilum flexile TaxID=125627 RepID=UPI0004767A9C|nr:DEAD/DEAH box helicase family protein [Thiofilum flexile]
MSNFQFLPNTFNDFKQAAQRAESHIYGDPRAACFHARFALESAVHWLYRHDSSLHMPYDHKLGSLLHEPSFQNQIPQQIYYKAKAIQQVGNMAVHDPRPLHTDDAKRLVKELHHIAYWLARSYTTSIPLSESITWQEDKIPRPLSLDAVVPRKNLEELEKKLAAESEKNLQQQQERDQLNQELQKLRAELMEVRKANEAKTDTHDYSETETRDYLIDIELHRAGWPLNQSRDKEYKVSGMPNNKGVGYADYVLWGDDDKPLAVVEAKRTNVDAAVGQQQAKLYADCLEQMHGQRPLIFYTNGYDYWLWDDTRYSARKVQGFYNKDALERLIRRRDSRQELETRKINTEIAGRYYQKRVIGSIFEQFNRSQRKALLVMATGTGKTRTAIALVDVLQRANWVKRALFLADRVSLVNQAANAFKKHLPDSSPVNLVTEKDNDGRVYVCTYPTMMGLIDESNPKNGEARFGVGYFDLIIIDEAHRSVYQKYQAIFNYFDALLVGLTATPSEHVDKNTYTLFDLETSVPTDAYELETAVKDGFLVPPRVKQVDLKFPHNGIDYDSLSEEEKEEWDSKDWGQHEDGQQKNPAKVDAAAVNKWLFNKDTVDKMLQYLMEHGHKVDGGDRLGKTVIFARNHKHAEFIEERFNHHYPHYAGHFARIIDNQSKYPQSLIDDFSIANKAPHIAISVDMLDTGIDVPEILNLVFFKPVYSRIKFWQMVGRGTRLCSNLFALGEDKKDFRIFDFCANYKRFKENPLGIETSNTVPLGTRLFRSRAQLLGALHTQKADPAKQAELAAVQEAVTNELYATVKAMNPDNFIVRTQMEVVERFQERKAWNSLTEEDSNTLQQKLATLPSEISTDPIESRAFDLNIVQMQLALLYGDQKTYERNRQKILIIADKLEDKATIPSVAAQIDYLTTIQEQTFWEGMNIELLETLRRRIRSLVTFIQKEEQPIVYTDFKDEIIGESEETAIEMPRMTGTQYAKKVKEYLNSHLNNIVIHRLRTNQPLTETDLQNLESTLQKIGDEEGETLLSNLLQQSEAPTLAYFVRSMVGMDRQAAQAAFTVFLEDRSLTPPQIRFIEMLIDQLTARGVMKSDALYEAPFNSLHGDGPEALFAGKDNVIEGIFSALEATLPPIQKIASA